MTTHCKYKLFWLGAGGSYTHNLPKSRNWATVTVIFVDHAESTGCAPMVQCYSADPEVVAVKSMTGVCRFNKL